MKLFVVGKPYGLLTAMALATAISAPAALAGKVSGTTTLLKDKEQILRDVENRVEEDTDEQKSRILGLGVLRNLFKDIGNRVEVPGFMSLRANKSLGEIVGPAAILNTIQTNTEVYLRWKGLTRPALGEIYAVYTPGVVLQNRTDFTDFIVRYNSYEAKGDLSQYSHAGYIYESNGEIEIIDISRGVVKARVIRGIKQLSVGDQIMKPLPRFSNIEPVSTSIRMTATIVAGSPYDNINATQGSMLYLNRGRRDGVKVGSLFQTLEPVYLTDGPPIKKADGLGVAMVVYASDAYSTAIILKQFNAIRVGTLMESMRAGPNRASQFNLLSANGTRRAGQNAINPDAYLSELDQIERDSDILALSPEERERLERLHLQELRRRNRSLPGGGEGQALPDPSVDEGAAPQVPPAPDLFQSSEQRRKARSRRIRQRQENKKLSDEEELNSLFE